jgi:hypothetical protein
LLVGEGAAALTRNVSAKLTFVLAAFLLAQPVFDVLWHRVMIKRDHLEYDSHGDLHPDVLDYLEWLEKTKKRDEMMRNARAKRLETEKLMPAEGEAPAAPP